MKHATPSFAAQDQADDALAYFVFAYIISHRGSVERQFRPNAPRGGRNTVGRVIARYRVGVSNRRGFEEFTNKRRALVALNRVFLTEATEGQFTTLEQRFPEHDIHGVEFWLTVRRIYNSSEFGRSVTGNMSKGEANA